MGTHRHRRKQDRRNLWLKAAIAASGNTQRRIALLTRIPEVRLSAIIRGRNKATDPERERLAKILNRSEQELFPAAPIEREARTA